MRLLVIMKELTGLSVPLVRVEGILNSQRYTDILDVHLIHFMEGLEGEFLDYEFQQDNALVHK